MLTCGICFCTRHFCIIILYFLWLVDLYLLCFGVFDGSLLKLVVGVLSVADNDGLALGSELVGLFSG